MKAPRNIESLLDAYRVVYAGFAVGRSDVATVLGVSPQTASRLLGTLRDARLIDTYDVNQEAQGASRSGAFKEVVWQCLQTHDSVNEVEALAIFERAFGLDASPANPANVELSDERAALDEPVWDDAKLAASVSTHSQEEADQIAADAATPREDSRTSTKETTMPRKTKTKTASSRSRAAAPPKAETPTPAEQMEQAQAKLDMKALYADLKKRIKAAIRDVSFKDAPSGDYTTIKTGTQPIAYLFPRGKSIVAHLGLTEKPEGVELTLTPRERRGRPRFALQTKITTAEEVDDLLKCIEAAAAVEAAPVEAAAVPAAE